NLLARLIDKAGGDPVAFGADFAFGVPRAFAKSKGISDFLDWLRGLTGNEQIFQVCTSLDEASLDRPFYPQASVKGHGHMARLADKLGFSKTDDLRRYVDFPTSRRRGGSPLFWTLGPNQCGKATLSAWRECLLPAFRQNLSIMVWPYAGKFADLLEPGKIVVAETYPAEALVQFGLTLVGSKRKQSDRATLRQSLMETMDRFGAVPSHHLVRISHEGRCIGAPNLRKCFCNKDLLRLGGISRCRQSVARICLNFHGLKDAVWWRVSTAGR
ncbi:MAG: hypothetical protein M0Z85_05235, partial [Gammaproteobacteria bacterium]|nr:hypothetical protein [Gammaproteobacteria bacterium]